jgi:hypothetical protein
MITYLPHIGTSYPKYYIGSKYDYKGNYYGSVDSKQIYEYTCGKSLRDWWKEQKRNPENFKFEILAEYKDLTAIQLVEHERDLHIKMDVLSDQYFNHSIATKGFCSRKRSLETKKIVSNKTKQYWNSEDGLLKKKRLSERNKNFQSNWMLEKWKNPSDAMLNRLVHGRPKGSKDLSQRTPRTNIKKVKCGDVLYNDAFEASCAVGVHPVSIRRWCKNKINDWSYVE